MIPSNELIIKLEQIIPAEHKDEIFRSLYWIDSGIKNIDMYHKSDLVIVYEGAEPIDALTVSIHRKIKDMLSSLEAIPRKTYWKHSPPEKTSNLKLMEELLNLGYVRKVANGAYSFSGIILKLFKELDRQILKLACDMGADEELLPQIISLDTMKQAGYLEYFPQHVIFCSHLEGNSRTHNDFLKNFREKSSITSDLKHHNCLSPTVCYPFFQSRMKEVVSDQKPTIVTAMSSCFRHEGTLVKDLSRLQEFRMREIMAVGSQECVKSLLEKFLDIQKFVLDFCEIEGRIQTANDPFFIDGHEKKRIFQLSLDLKYETSVSIKNGRENIAVGSVNYHQDLIGRKFNISDSTGQVAHSACLGVGLDRLCFAFLDRHGLDQKKWPKQLKFI